METMWNTKKFSDIFANLGTFETEYKTSGLYVEGYKLSDKSIVSLYYLLYARYANSPIANDDENQFKYKVWSIIFQYATIWEKKLDIQAKLRSMSEEDIMEGSRQLNNHAFHNGTAPSTGTNQEMLGVNQQDVSKYKKGKVEAYMQLWTALESDVTEELLNRFVPLFLQIAKPIRPILFESEA